MALSPEFQRFRRRLLIPLGILTVTHVLGTLGFWWDWKDDGADVMDALFMTFMTVTTLGYEIQYPLSGAGRVITMLVAGAGIGSLFFAFGVAMEFVVSEGLTGARRRNRMQKAIDELSGHFILAGMGRVGREAAAEFRAAGVKWVLVDPADELVQRLQDEGGLAVKGDATEDEVLRRAGVERARGLIVTTARRARLPSRRRAAPRRRPPAAAGPRARLRGTGRARTPPPRRGQRSG